MTLLLTLGQDTGTSFGRFSFDTPTANANGYASEVGNKALAVWAGAANVAAGKLQSNTTALMRARFNAGAQPGTWRAVFNTPASVASAEFYLDFRDNGTNRLSVAMEAAGSRIYLFDGYTASILVQTAATMLANTTYTIEVLDTPGLISVFLNAALVINFGTSSGAGATSGGVTTAGQIVTIDTLEASA